MTPTGRINDQFVCINKTILYYISYFLTFVFVGMLYCNKKCHIKYYILYRKYKIQISLWFSIWLYLVCFRLTGHYCTCNKLTQFPRVCFNKKILEQVMSI